MDISREQWRDSYSADFELEFYVKLTRAYYELWREIRDCAARESEYESRL